MQTLKRIDEIMYSETVKDGVKRNGITKKIFFPMYKENLSVENLIPRNISDLNFIRDMHISDDCNRSSSFTWKKIELKYTDGEDKCREVEIQYPLHETDILISNIKKQERHYAYYIHVPVEGKEKLVKRHHDSLSYPIGKIVNNPKRIVLTPSVFFNCLQTYYDLDIIDYRAWYYLHGASYIRMRMLDDFKKCNDDIFSESNMVIDECYNISKSDNELRSFNNRAHMRRKMILNKEIVMNFDKNKPMVTDKTELIEYGNLLFEIPWAVIYRRQDGE